MTIPDNRGPWGIAVTGTLHLAWPGFAPACGDDRVQLIVDGVRRRYRSGDYDAPPIYGLAEGRPVCRRCISTLRRADELIVEAIEVAESYNREREDDRG